jgi:hypothetical protein
MMPRSWLLGIVPLMLALIYLEDWVGIHRSALIAGLNGGVSVFLLELAYKFVKGRARHGSDI